MAGMMSGAKGLGAARMGKGKTSPNPKSAMDNAPTPPPRSVHIREANGGFIVSKHGGSDDPFGGAVDHIAKNFKQAMGHAKSHLGIDANKPMGAASDDADEAGEDPKEEAMESAAEEAAEEGAEGASKKPKEPKPKGKSKPAGPGSVKKRPYSETY